MLGGIEDSTLSATGNISALTVAGSVIESTLASTAGGFGRIAAGAAPGSVVFVGGLTIKGSAIASEIAAETDVAKLTVTGQAHTLGVTFGEDVGTIAFGRSVRSSDLSVEGSIGTLTAGTTPGSVKITGGISVKGAVLDSAIRTDGDLAKLTVGIRMDDSVVSARGESAPADLIAAQTIGVISVAGRLSGSSIFAGYDTTGAAVNADVQIGAVKVGTHWIASNLIAGATPGPDPKFGNSNDTRIAGGGPIVSRIASLVITGTARGTVGGGDHFGIVTEEIALLSVSATKLPILAGPSNDLTGLPIGSTPDFRVREV